VNYYKLKGTNQPVPYRQHKFSCEKPKKKFNIAAII